MKSHSDLGILSHWQRLKPLLADALTIPFADRERYLVKVCSGDPALLLELRALIEAYEMTGPLDRLAERLRADVDPPTLAPGDMVGDFRVLELVRRGGMGTVYLGLREREGFSQRAAIKIVPRGPHATELALKFRHERRILAELSHPNIALFIDGGVTEDGDLYLAMEFVDGLQIDDFVTERKLDVSARLALFRAVCRAVRYAHQHLVVHRDLKPSNIMVTQDGQPKLLDFGIAQLMTDPSGGGAVKHDATRLTPEYASPEQLAGGAVNLASDVYQLGLLLRQLLTGARPSDSEGDANYAAHGVSPDLRAVIRRALQPDPGLRYGSVDGLLADLDRVRERRPVEALPRTRGYRARLFLRRHFIGLSAATAVSAALVAGMMATTRQAARAEREAEAAIRERDYAQEVAATMTGMFALADPNQTPEQVGAIEILDRASADVRVRLTDQPELRSRLLHEIGRVYFNMGMLDRSADALEEVVRASRETDGKADRVLAASFEYLGLVNERRTRTEEAEANFREALAVLEALPHNDELAVAAVKHELGEFLSLQGRGEEGIPLLEEALAIRRRLLPLSNPDVFSGVFELANAYHTSMQFDRAVELFQEVITIGEEVPAETGTMVATSRLSLGTMLTIRGDFSGAEPHIRRALEMRRELYGPENAFTLEVEQSLALLLSRSGRYAEALDLLYALLPKVERAFGDDGQKVLSTRAMLVSTLIGVGRYQEAVDVQAEAIASVQRSLGTNHPLVVTPLLLLSRSLVMLGRPDSAAAVASAALEATVATFGERHAWVARHHQLVGMIAFERGRLDSARVRFELARDLSAELLRESHPDVVESRRLLANTRLAQGEVDAALGALAEVIAIRREDLPPRHPDLAAALQDYGEALTVAGRPAEAEPVLREAIVVWDEALPAESWRRSDARSALGAALTLLGNSGEARRLLESSVESLPPGPGVVGRAATRAYDRLREAEQPRSPESAPETGRG